MTGSMENRGGARPGAVIPAGILALALLTPTAGAAESASGASLRTVDLDGLRDVLQGERGRVVVLNFWATWCAPCREEFPDLVRVARENPAGLTLITVSLDDPGMAGDGVLSFLREMEVPGLTFIRTPGDPDPFIRGIDPEWSGALPATFVHAADGRRAGAVHGPIDYARLDRMVRPLLSGER